MARCRRSSTPDRQLQLQPVGGPSGSPPSTQWPRISLPARSEAERQHCPPPGVPPHHLPGDDRRTRMLTDSDRFAFTTRRHHAFASIGNAYDAVQCDEAIRTGDTLIVLAEEVVGIAMTWLFAVTQAHGNLHALSAPPSRSPSAAMSCARVTRSAPTARSNAAPAATPRSSCPCRAGAARQARSIPRRSATSSGAGRVRSPRRTIRPL